jgi:hypothetical protein
MNGPPVLKPVFGVFAVVGWLVLIGLHILWHYTLGWVFTTLADLLDRVSIPTGLFGRKHLFGSVSSWLRSLDRNVDNALVHAANNLEHAAVWLFSRVGYLVGWFGRELKGLALAVEQKFLRFASVTIPRFIHSLLAVVWRELRALGRYARKMLPKLARQLFRFSKWAVHEIAKGARHVGFLWKWAKAVLLFHWHVIHGLLRRVYKVEHALLPKGFRKLFVAALGPLGVLWILNDTVFRWALYIMAHPGETWEWVKDQVVFVLNENVCLSADFAYDVAVFVLEPVFRREIGLTLWICHPERGDLPHGCTYPTRYAGSWEPHGTPTEAELGWGTERLAPGVPLPAGVIQA